MMRGLQVALVVMILTSLAGCSGSSKELRLDSGIEMTVKFIDPGWDGQTVPVGGRCGDCGGGGRSPALRIGGLSAEVNEVVVEFNDLRIKDLAKNGGHGTLVMATGGKAEIILPSVREETMSLPRGVRCVRKHQCVFFGHKAGAYKAPCGCGQGNEYVAKVMAVRRNGEDIEVLAQKEVPIGIF